jgi:hypothetical protein
MKIWISPSMACAIAISCAACASAPEPTDPPEAIATTKQAQDNDSPPPDKKYCTDLCYFEGMVHCANQCATGPGASACIGECVDAADLCYASCMHPARPTLPPPKGDPLPDRIGR